MVECVVAVVVSCTVAGAGGDLGWKGLNLAIFKEYIYQESRSSFLISIEFDHEEINLSKCPNMLFDFAGKKIISCQNELGPIRYYI